MFGDDIGDGEMCCKFGRVLMIIEDKDEPENEYKRNALHTYSLPAMLGEPTTTK